jgi:hypothetical protein
MPTVIAWMKGSLIVFVSWIETRSGVSLKYVVAPEDDAFVARCLNPDVASDGGSQIEAVANLREALELYFEDDE